MDNPELSDFLLKLTKISNMLLLERLCINNSSCHGRIFNPLHCSFADFELSRPATIQVYLSLRYSNR